MIPSDRSRKDVRFAIAGAISSIQPPQRNTRVPAALMSNPIYCETDDWHTSGHQSCQGFSGALGSRCRDSKRETAPPDEQGSPVSAQVCGRNRSRHCVGVCQPALMAVSDMANTSEIMTVGVPIAFLRDRFSAQNWAFQSFKDYTISDTKSRSCATRSPENAIEYLNITNRALTRTLRNPDFAALTGPHYDFLTTADPPLRPFLPGHASTND